MKETADKAPVIPPPTQIVSNFGRLHTIFSKC